MFHRRTPRLAIVVVLTLLLTAVLVPAAAAQSPPPTITPGDGDGGDDNGDTPAPDPGDGTGPPDPGDGNGSTTPPDPGNGDDKDMDDKMGNGETMTPSMPPSDSWPPPNAIVRHPATPVQISALGGGLRIYLIAPDGAATTGPVLATLSDLAEMHPSGDPVELYSGTIPGSGKPVTIEYLPAEMKLRVSTFYADKPPHDFDKAYIYTVDADHSVTHERW